MNKRLILLAILLLGFILSSYGINWGLPHRWNVDEQVATALRMVGEKSFVPYDLSHPPLYLYCLIIFLSPYFILLKIINFPFDFIVSAASISWLKLSLVVPEFATSVFLIARMLSAVFGVLTIYAVFLIGKQLYDENTGLISALTLSLCMGFASANHFAQGTSLVNFLYAVTVFFCLKAVDSSDSRKNFFIASFLAGLSLSAKYNGAILIFPLLMASIFIYRKNSPGSNRMNNLSVARGMILDKNNRKGVLCYLAGVLLGWPTLITNLKGYYKLFLSENFKFLFTNHQDYAALKIKTSYVYGIFNYLKETMHIFGLPISLFVIGGLFYCAFLLFKKNTFIKKEKLALILISVLPYFLIVSSFHRPVYIKYLILVVPVMAVTGGIAIYKFLGVARFLKFKYFIVVVSFIFSFFYTLSSDLVFAKKDTRYEATDWITKNIANESTIEIFTQPSWVLSSSIFPKHNIIFLGESSFGTKNLNIYKAFKNSHLTYAGLESYFKEISKKMTHSDYILIPYFSDIDNYLLTGPEGDKFIYNLLNEKLNYKLVKEFSSKGHWYWDTKTDYTSPTILIFKKTP